MAETGGDEPYHWPFMVGPPYGRPVRSIITQSDSSPMVRAMSSASTRFHVSGKSMILVAMFLLADIAYPFLDNAPLQDSPEVDSAPSNAFTWTYNTSIDTHIDSTVPSNTYGSETTALIGVSGTFESRMLIEFTLNLSSSMTVHSATLDLECFNSDGDATEFYITNVTSAINETNANWMGPNTSQSWDIMGADSSKDRSAWEPSVDMLSNGTVSLNITRQIQVRAANNWSSARYIISGTSSQSECYTSDYSNSTYHPSLSVVLSNSSAGAVGELTPDWIEDGHSLMTGDFILSADTTPTMSWKGWNGTGVEVQLSQSSEFRQSSDEGGHWTSMSNASIFQTGTGTGSMTVPASEAVSNGSTMFYRMRSISSDDQIGKWQSGWFNLPGHNITDNGDGTATLNITSSDLGLDDKTIWDAELDSSQKTTPLGSESTIKIGTDTSPDTEYKTMLRLNAQHLGLPTNVTIVSNEFVMQKSSSSGTVLVSDIHVENHMDWVEEDATWNSPLGDSNDWDTELHTSFVNYNVSSSTSEIRYNSTIGFQSYVATGTTEPVDFLMVGKMPDEDSYSSNEVTFHSTEASSSSDQPYWKVTYKWSANTYISDVEMLHPIEGQGVWNLSGHNLSGNTTPELTWKASASSGNEILYQFSDDKFFRNIVKEVDTAVDNDFQVSDGSFNLTASDGLSTGKMYYWRMAQVDSNGTWSSWNEQSFFITDLNSTYLGGDRYQFNLRDGNASSDGLHPSCQDTYIDGGTPTSNYDSEEEMQVSYNTIFGGSETAILFGCHLMTHGLPDGYAVVEAKLRYKMSYASGNPYVGAYESHQHNWTEEKATWNQFDGRNSWGTVGAKGWERGQLLSSTTISGSSESWFEWNVTLGVQNAMRNGENFDVILAVLGAGTGNSREALLYGNSVFSSSNKAELIFTYVPGSSALPDEPTPLSPANGSWSVEDGIERSAIPNPLLKWNYSGNTNASGFVIDIDSNTSFDSADLLSYGSWTSSGFDLTNMTFQVPVDLSVGETWYWRVRAISSTNQIGNWSQYNHFHVPDLTTWTVDSDSAAVELRHKEAMPSLGVPLFVDTWVAHSGTDLNSSHGSDSSLILGERSDGSTATTLMKIPLTDIPMPQNATLERALLNLYCEWGTSSTQRVSIHAVNGYWNESATGLTRDGSANWSANSTTKLSDIRGDVFFEVQNVSVTNWMSFDITYLAQKAHAAGVSHIELALVADDDRGEVKFSSSDSSSDQPWANLTWTTGAQPASESAATGGAPDGEVLWDNSSVALLPAGTPTLNWTHANGSSIDSWRLYMFHDSSDVRAGWSILDSTVDAGFTLANLSYTPPSNLSSGKCYLWAVQAVDDHVLGSFGQGYTFCLPNWLGGAINSTDAYAEIQDGSALPQINEPDYFMDTWLDGIYTNANHASNTSLVVGDPPHTGILGEATTVMMYNLSGNPIKTPYEVVSATLSLYKNSGVSNSQNISVSVLNWGFVEGAATWNQRANGSSWNAGGALGAADAGLPLDVVEVSTDGWYTWDISHAAQLGHLYGHQNVWLLFRSEDSTKQWHQFASSEDPDIEYRPKLNLTWRSGNGWTPSDSTGQSPASGNVMWDVNAERPSPQNPLEFDWNSSDSNISEWEFQYGTNSRFIGSFVRTCSSLTCTTNSNATPYFDVANLSFHIPIDVNTTEDEWIYWRVRAIQGDRLGNWSSPMSFRIPAPQGSDDGSGNHSVTLYRDAVFEKTGSLPSVPDTWIDSAATSTNHGSSTNLTLGMSHGGSGDTSILIEFDLGELAFPQHMIPTQVLLKLYRYQVIGISPLTVSAHACGAFFENTVTQLSAPTCNATEITRSTVGTFPPEAWVEWDVTSLAQSNVLSGNKTMTIMLTSVGTPSTGMVFHSSDYWNNSLRPKLEVEYVDNANGSLPPAQPTLISPIDGQAVYQENNWILSADTQPMLEWNPVQNATGYIVTISNASGRNKYRSWEDTGFNGSTYLISSDLSPGEKYEWWVQAINGSIPGPSSSRWSFGIGSPVNNTYNGDLTWTYELRQSQEVEELVHPDVLDGWIGNASPAQSHPNEDLLVGEGCGSGAGVMPFHECKALFTVDISDIPLPANASAHSASIRFTVMDLHSLSGGMSMRLSVHPLINLPFSDQGSTWLQSSSGNLWSAAGMQEGVDYGPAIDSVNLSLTSLGEVFWFDLTHPSLCLSCPNHFVIVGTTTSMGQMNAELYSSEALVEAFRPLVLFNYTNVNNIAINPGTGVNIDADTNVSFTYGLYDSDGNQLTQNVTWSAENGNIDSTGLFTPYKVGVWNISACFGAICNIIQINVNPGAPVLHSVTPVSGSIDADSTLDLMVVVVDQHGNLVPGVSLSWSVTNGTLTSITAPSGYNEAVRFEPHTAGQQTVTVSWNNVDIDVVVQVATGAPSSFDLAPCAESVAAGLTCQFNYQLRDAKGNALDISEAGLLSWQVENGNISNTGLFSADKVGTWTVNLSSASGVEAQSSITVLHGQIEHLRVEVSNTTVTADEVVWLNTTRVDIRGNEMQVELEQSDWEVQPCLPEPCQRGLVINGTPAQFHPVLVGNRWVKASFEGVSTTVYIDVEHGAMVQMEIERNQMRNGSLVPMLNDQMTTDDVDRVTLRAWGNDADGNRWTIEATWGLSTSQAFAQYCEDNMVAPTCYFEADVALPTPYEMTATYSPEGSQELFSVEFYFEVSHGVLDSMEFDSEDGLEFDIKVGQKVQFTVVLKDADGNEIPNVGDVSFMLSGSDSDDEWQFNLSQALWAEDLEWSPGLLGQHSSEYRSDIVGSYTLNASIASLSTTASIDVEHGDPVSFVIAEQPENYQIIAGQTIVVKIDAYDSAGNQFTEAVEWNGQQQGTNVWLYDGIGQVVATGPSTYSITLTKVTEDTGPHILRFSHALVNDDSDVLNITVYPAEIGRLVLEVGTESVEQLESFDISITAFDIYDNEILVPTSIEVSATGRATAEKIDGDFANWRITTLDEGKHTVSIAANNASGFTLSESATYTVEGNLAGFFESGGTMYYVGAGLGAFVLIGLAAVVIILVRRSGDDYDEFDDDYDEGYDEYEDDSAPAPGPAEGPQGSPQDSGMAGPQGGPQDYQMNAYGGGYDQPANEQGGYEEYSAQDDGNYRVDENGTEWWQDEAGIWWYRGPGESDWSEWRD